MEQQTLYYYAARVDDGRHSDTSTARFPHRIAKNWDIDFLLYHPYLEEGMYDHDNGKRYYLSKLSWEEFDMLRAFGVTCATDFRAVYPCMDPYNGETVKRAQRAHS